jgi:hypothetical protein
LHGLMTISCSAVLSLGLLFALAVVMVRGRRSRAAGSASESGGATARAASVAAAKGAIWGLVAFPVLCGLALAAFKLLQRL